MAVLVALIGVMILAATWLSANRTIEVLSSSLIERTADHTERELDRFFGAVRADVLNGRAWAERGMLDATDHEAMNALFVPILEQHPQVSSMMVADSDGAEYLLLRDPLDPGKWTNRVVQADAWGDRVLNREWDAVSGEAQEDFGELDYDPRTRVWYQRALETTDSEPVYWTEPVIFFITKDPGITASTHLSLEGDTPQTTVVAFDLLLMDISRFTSRLQISPRGMAFVLVEDEESGTLQVVGLPSDPRYEDDAAIRDALMFVPPRSAVADAEAQLPTPEQLEVPAVTLATESWTTKGTPRQPLRFQADGESWWGGFRPFELGDNKFWIAVVVPEEDLSSGLRLQQYLLSGVVLAALAAGISRAYWLARRFGRPIEALVRQSERISKGDLEPGPKVVSSIDEIRRLSEAHDEMREGLEAVIKLEKLERDLDIARDIQQGLLPEESPETPGFRVAGWNKPADQTGGDYFDWLTLPNGQTVFTLADVTGHGIGPALIVAVYRAYMRSAADGSQVNLREVAARINELLCVDIPEERFITAALGVVHPKTRKVELLSAGQAPLLFYEAATDTLHNWDADDLPLGLVEGIDFGSPREIPFAPGDLLVITTDGFFEAANPAGELFGIEAVERFIRDNHLLHPDEFIQKLYQQVEAHAAGQPQGDDLTALVIQGLDGPT